MDPQPSSTGVMYWYPREEGILFRATPTGRFLQVDGNIRFVIVLLLQLIVFPICLDWKSWGHVPPTADTTAVSHRIGLASGRHRIGPGMTVFKGSLVIALHLEVTPPVLFSPRRPHTRAVLVAVVADEIDDSTLQFRFCNL